MPPSDKEGLERDAVPTEPPPQADYRLVAHGFTIALKPARGGTVTRLDWCPVPGGTIYPLLRPEEPPIQPQSQRPACFPMLPFVNRIADGRFTWRDRGYALAANRPGEPHAIHGFGFQAPWSVIDEDHARIRLVHAHHDGQSPFSYSAELDLAITETGVSITLVLTHHGAETMAYGLGLHPYFPDAAGAFCRFQADRWFPPGPDKLPRGPVPVDPDHDFTALRPVADAHGVDGTFIGWDGRALITWPEAGYRLALMAEGAFRAAHLYVPRDGGFFCFEPVSQLPNQLNHPDWAQWLAPILLAPGQACSGRLTLTPSVCTDERQT